MSLLSRCHDDTLGPLVYQCPHRLDFTLRFEDVFFVILPSCIFTIAAVVRLSQLVKGRTRVAGRFQRWLKVVALIALCLLQCVAIATLVVNRGVRNVTTLVALVLAATSTALAAALSFTEHQKTLRPSTVLIIFLGLTSVSDMARTRTIWMLAPDTTFGRVTIASLVLKCIIFWLESVSKTRYIVAIEGETTPEETSNVVCLSFSYWLKDVLMRGAKGSLSISDLHELDSVMSARHLDDAFAYQWSLVPTKSKTDNTILWCCGRILVWPLLGVVPLRVIAVALMICQPILLQLLVKYLGASDSVPQETGRSLVVAYILVYPGLALTLNLYWYHQIRTITKLRACLITVIARHTIKVDLSQLQDHKIALTLMSNDVERAVTGIRFLHEIWANALQTVLATYLLARQVGVACAVPVTVAILASIALARVVNSIGFRQGKWMEAVQQRIAGTTELLASIKGVKMKGLESKFFDLLRDLRSHDIACGNKFRAIMASVAVLSFVPEFFSPFLMFTVLVEAPSTFSSRFDASTLFTSLSLLLILTQPLNNMFQVLPGLMAGINSMKRIGAFLLTPMQEEYRRLGAETKALPLNDATTSGHDEAVGSSQSEELLTDVSRHRVTKSTPPLLGIVDGSLCWGHGPNVLLDLNLSIPKQALTIIAGPVGCGKSTLCETIIGQPRLTAGDVFLDVDLSHIAYCSQTPHLTNASIRDNIVAYSPYEHAWYEEVIECVSLTDDISAMPGGHDTIVGSGGARLSGGQRQRVAIARAIYARRRVVVLDDVLSGLDKPNADTIFNKVIGPSGILRQHSTTVVFVTHQARYLPKADRILLLGPTGKLIYQGSYSELPDALALEEHVESDIKDKDEEPPLPKKACQSGIPSPNETSKPTIPDVLVRSRHTDTEIYAYFTRTVGLRHILILISLSIMAAVFWNYSTFWLKIWADSPFIRSTHTSDRFYLGIYAMLQCLTILLLAGVAFQALTNVAARSGEQLHSRLLHSVLAAPLAILTSMDSGQILNKFSQDIMVIDVELPLAVMNLAVCVVMAVGQSLLIIVSAPFAGISFPLLTSALYFIQQFYLRTSKQLRLMDLESKSPLHSFFLEITSGLSTIRAFNWSEEAIAELQGHLDHSQKPFYFLAMIQQWLNFVLDLVVAIVAIVIAITAVMLTSRGSSVAVALIQVISFQGVLRQLIITWTTIETGIGAVTRIKDFSENTSIERDNLNPVQPPAAWPSRGEIEIEAVSASYQPESNEMALSNITLSFAAGAKVGLCGRSGSGKSSLALSLFRMIDLTAGSISIDGIELSSLPLKTIRSHLNAVPQDCCFLPISIRTNLQPPDIEELSDAAMIDVLRKTRLWDIVEAKGGLDTPYEPSMFSHGQKQLLSLASSLLKPSKVVVLDEFTSSVDAETDRLMQDLVKEQFADSTIISIAHRLDTILDCDQVVVLQEGKVIESGPPKDLLAKGQQNSAFAKLLSAHSKAES